MFRSWVLNDIWIIDLSSALVGSSFKLSVRLLFQLYCVIVIKHVVLFTICAKLQVTMSFAFTFLDIILVSNLTKNIGGSTEFAHRYAHPYSPHSLKNAGWLLTSFGAQEAQARSSTLHRRNFEIYIFVWENLGQANHAVRKAPFSWRITLDQ